MQRPYFVLFTPLFLAVMLSSSPATCWARKETATKLTLEKAIERALQHNRQLKSSTLDLSSRQVYLDEAWDRFSVQISPLSSINYSAVSDEEQVVWKVGSEISKNSVTASRSA